MAAFGLVHHPPQRGAGTLLLERATLDAQGGPILVDPVDAERLALRGARVWISNPLDAFPRRAQRAYIDWVRGAGAPSRAVRIVLVTRGSAAQLRLAHDAAFRELGRDKQAVLYGRV